jgi:hypothetical protein
MHRKCIVVVALCTESRHRVATASIANTGQAESEGTDK